MTISFFHSMSVSSYDFGSPFTQTFDNSGGSSLKLPLYIGKSYPGALKSDAFWQIYKLTYDTNDTVTDIQWAGGNTNFVNVWNSRASLTYA